MLSELRLLIVLRVETAIIAIFSCFSIFNDIFLIARFPTTRSNPITIDTASIPITSGAETIVERRLTQVIPNQIAVTRKQLSITSIIFTGLLYFILSSFRLSLSAINISYISSIFLRRYICPSLPSVSSFSIFSVYNFFLKVTSQNHTKNGYNFKCNVRA